MFRKNEGQLLQELKTLDNDHLRKVAEIIQRTRPDFLTLMEFDYVPENEAVRLFQENYLGKSQNETEPLSLIHI